MDKLLQATPGVCYLIHQQLQVGLDGNTDHVGAVNGLPVRREAAELSQGATDPPHFPSGKPQSREGTNGKMGAREGAQGGSPRPGQQIPHSFVLEAEARAGAVDVITGTTVVQQAEVERGHCLGDGA